MAKIIRLNESDLTRIVKRVVENTSEKHFDSGEAIEKILDVVHSIIKKENPEWPQKKEKYLHTVREIEYLFSKVIEGMYAKADFIKD